MATLKDPFPKHANVRWQLILDLFGFGVGAFQQVAHKRAVDGIKLCLINGAGRRMMYWKYSGKNYKNWKHHGPGRYWHGPHWGPGCPPWEENQPESESDSPPAESEESNP